MTRYTAVATREESGWWSIVADLGTREVASQARRFNECEAMIREAIALVLDVDESSVTVDVIPDLGDLNQVVSPARAARAEMVAFEQDLRALTSVAVAELRGRDFTMREIATLLDVATSRVSQIDAAPADKNDYVLAAEARGRYAISD